MAGQKKHAAVRSVHLSIIANSIHKVHPSISESLSQKGCFRVDSCAISHAMGWEPPSTVPATRWSRLLLLLLLLMCPLSSSSIPFGSGRREGPTSFSDDENIPM